MKQSTHQILMVSPHFFGSNPYTAESNGFQHFLPPAQLEEVRSKALKEWQMFVSLLRSHQIEVICFDDTSMPHTPDAVFPNNWISFHQDGQVVVYPMYAPNRRDEIRQDIVRHFQEQYGLSVWNMAEELEGESLFLEGTGSLVLDRVNKVAYACTSPRTTPQAFDRWTQKMGFKGILFQAIDPNGLDIYHTNVLMALGSEFALVCMDAIIDPAARGRILYELNKSKHSLIAITLNQMSAFAGNVLEVENLHGERFIVLSQRAYDSLTRIQQNQLSQHGQLLVIPIDVLETFSGGGVRCMMAEVFQKLDKKPSFELPFS